jgi:hypothetical protein
MPWKTISSGQSDRDGGPFNLPTLVPVINDSVSAAAHMDKVQAESESAKKAKIT